LICLREITFLYLKKQRNNKDKKKDSYGVSFFQIIPSRKGKKERSIKRCVSSVFHL